MGRTVHESLPTRSSEHDVDDVGIMGERVVNLEPSVCKPKIHADGKPGLRPVRYALDQGIDSQSSTLNVDVSTTQLECDAES